MPCAGFTILHWRLSSLLQAFTDRTQTGIKATVTLFHSPSSQASTRVLTLLKQASAQSTSSATQDQASNHEAQNEAQYAPFELDVQTSEPTSDQLRNIVGFLGGGTGGAGKAVEGASSEDDAFRKPASLKRPLIVDWTGGKAGRYIE